MVRSLRGASGVAVSLGNMAMRGVSLVARLALTVYIARLLGLEALGVFGLLAGLAGTAPIVLGFGISYYVNREILLCDPVEGFRLLRDRLAVSSAIAALVWIVAGVVVVTGLYPPSLRLLICGVIVTLELVAFDLHIGMINLRRPIAANFLLFVRSASWIFPVIGLGVAVPALRQLDVLLWAWLVALVLNFVLVFVVLRDVAIWRLARFAVDWRRTAMTARRNPWIYANDLALAGQTYADRAIVAQMVGIAAAGIYTLYFSVAHGVYVLVAAATTQLAPPRLMAARVDGGVAGWRRTLFIESGRASGFGITCVIIALAMTWVALPLLGFHHFLDQVGLFALMIAATLLKPLGELTNASLYCFEADRTLVTVNILGVVLSIVGSIACLWMFGLIGVGISALLTQAGLILARSIALRRLARLTG